MSEEVKYIQMPRTITSDMVSALRNDPLVNWEECEDDFYERLGWLVAAYSVMTQDAPLIDTRRNV